MKLQFRQQPFRAEAAKAVCDIFEGRDGVEYETKSGAVTDQPMSDDMAYRVILGAWPVGVLV